MNMPGEKNVKHGKAYAIVLNGAKLVVVALFAVLVVFLIIYFSKKAYTLGYETATYEPVTSENEAVEIEVTITRSMTATDIGEMLIEAGLVNESLEAFLLQDRLSGLHDEYIPGTYTLDTSLTVDEILQIICTEEDDDN